MSNKNNSGFSHTRPMSCTYASVFPSYIHQQGNLTWFFGVLDILIIFWYLAHQGGGEQFSHIGPPPLLPCAPLSI